jgi:hypothetical protein
LASVGVARAPSYAIPSDTATAQHEPGRLSGLLRTDSPPGLAWLVPLGIAAVYLVVFLVQIPQNIRSIEWLSDYSSGFTVVETLIKTGTGGHTVLSFSGQYLPMWFGLLTAKLPLHRELWGIAPTLVFVASALLIGWTVAQLSTRWAGLLATLLVVVASPRALSFFMAGNAHNTVWLSTALLGVYLIWLTRAEGRKRATTLAVPPLAGIALGLCLGSDFLVGAAAAIPLALTGVAAGLRRGRASRRIAVSALSTAAVSVPVALLTSEGMKALGFVTLRTPLKLGHSALSVHAKLLFEGLNVLFNGYLRKGAPGTLHTELGLACEILMVLALLTLVILGARALIKFMSSGWRRDNPDTPAQLALSLHTIYWVASGATVCGAYWLASESSVGEIHESYFASVVLSVAAIIPLLLSRGSVARWLILAGASVFFAAGVAGLLSNYAELPGATQAARYEPEVMRLAKANHVSVGYAGYSEASSYTWYTDGRLTIRPVESCNFIEGQQGICPFALERVPSWYIPHQRHTFLLVDSAEGWLSTLPPGLGNPLATYSFGTVTMLIYPYDIAAHLGPIPD